MGQTAYNFDGIADVKAAAPATANVPRDSRGMPAVTSNTSDDPHPLFQMLGPLAHPETLTDFARLLTLPVDSVKKALAGALTASTARQAATSTANAVKAAPAAAVRTATKGFATIGDVVDPDIIKLASPRAGAAVELAQKVRATQAAAQASRAAAPVAEAAPMAAEAAPVAQAAAPVAQAAPVVGNGMPNQKLLNELAIQARRAGVKLTPEMEQTAIEAVGNGATPQQAVRGFAPLAPAEAAPAAPAPAPPAAPAPAPASVSQSAATVGEKFRLSSAEWKEYMRLTRKGTPQKDAFSLIQQQRELVRRMNLPSAEDARRAVADRNATGRWEP